MACIPDLSDSDKSPKNPRVFPRDAVDIRADLLLSEGPRFKVSVLDLSPAGFRIQTANHILINHIVYLTIPNFQPLQARVIWHYQEQYGCQLTRQMYGAVFAHIASAFPSLVSGNDRP